RPSVPPAGQQQHLGGRSKGKKPGGEKSGEEEKGTGNSSSREPTEEDVNPPEEQRRYDAEGGGNRGAPAVLQTRWGRGKDSEAAAAADDGVFTGPCCRIRKLLRLSRLLFSRSWTSEPER
ncbi:hypothetical protein XENORESO_021195, partial [Xenotaenia resolanae]